MSQKPAVISYTYIFEILPILQRGVFIHFHDIFNNFEYLPDHFNWAAGFGWNENYFLRSFLMYNDQFKVVLFSKVCWKQKLQGPDSRKNAPDYPFFTGGQFWMKKV